MLRSSSQQLRSVGILLGLAACGGLKNAEVQTGLSSDNDVVGSQGVRKNVGCPAGMELRGNECVAVVNKNCRESGTHWEDGRGCVPNVVAIRSQPASQPPSPSTAGGGTSCGTGRYSVLDPGTGGGAEDGSGLVRDTRTGLTWMRVHYRGSNMTQAASASYCQSKGMRLPTKDEALGIAAGNSENCAFPNCWWTFSSTSAGPGLAWYVSSYGHEYEADVGSDNRSNVLCVR